MDKYAIRDRRARAWADLQEILAGAEHESRNLTAKEREDYDAAERLVTELSGDLERLDSFDVHAKRAAVPAGSSEARRRELGAPAAVVSDRTDRLRPEQRMADYVQARGLRRAGEPSDLDLGKVVRGMMTGQWSNAQAEQRALAEGSSSAGGFLVPTVLSASIIDLARNRARVIQAGATTIPLESDLQNVPVQATPITPTWHSENALIAQSGPTFSMITFTAQTLAGMVTISRELLQDARVDLQSFVENSIAQDFALMLDSTALYGSGVAPVPRGLKNQSGTTVTSLGVNGATATWDNISAAVATVRGLNFEPNAVILAPRTEQKLATSKDTQGRYLGAPPDIADLPRLPTQQVPSNLTQGTATTASDIFVGQWDQLLFGIRLQVSLQVLQERYSDFYQTGILAVFRGDFQLAHPTAFDILTGAL